MINMYNLNLKFYHEFNDDSVYNIGAYKIYSYLYIEEISTYPWVYLLNTLYIHALV